MKKYQSILESSQEILAYRKSLIAQLETTETTDQNSLRIETLEFCICNINDALTMVFTALYERESDDVKRADYGEFYQTVNA